MPGEVSSASSGVPRRRAKHRSFPLLLDERLEEMLAGCDIRVCVRKVDLQHGRDDLEQRDEAPRVPGADDL